MRKEPPHSDGIFHLEEQFHAALLKVLRLLRSSISGFTSLIIFTCASNLLLSFPSCPPNRVLYDITLIVASSFTIRIFFCQIAFPFAFIMGMRNTFCKIIKHFLASLYSLAATFAGAPMTSLFSTFLSHCLSFSSSSSFSSTSAKIKFFSLSRT